MLAEGEVLLVAPGAAPPSALAYGRNINVSDEPPDEKEGRRTKYASKVFGLDAFTLMAMTIPCWQWLENKGDSRQIR